MSTYMFKLDSEGDLSLSENGNIEILNDINSSTVQSVQTILGTQKGTYFFDPDFGLDILNILGSRNDVGSSDIENIKLLVELFIKNEIDKETNVTNTSNFQFKYENVNRKLSISFNIVIRDQNTTVEVTI